MKILPSVYLALLLATAPVNAQEEETCPLLEILPDLPKKDLSTLLSAEHGFIMFGAEWCEPCRVVHPRFDGFKDRAYENGIPNNYLSFEDINIDVYSTDYDFLGECITGIPVIVETSNGQEIRRYFSHQIEELESEVESLINGYEN